MWNVLSTGLWLPLLLEVSALVTFGALALWAALRIIEKIMDWTTPQGPIAFPISAQRRGFAQNIGRWSVIVSEQDYRRRAGRLGLLRKLARCWWPLVAYVGLAQFLLFYGAKGISEEMNVSYFTGLLLIGGILSLLGIFRRKMLFDHLRGSFVPEGQELDWDSEAYMGGLRLRARFDNHPRKIFLERSEDKVLSKDGAQPFYFHGVMSQPDSVHWHGNGLLVSEFRMLDNQADRMTEQNWLKKIKERDALHATLSAYVLAGSQKASAIALLEYPGAVIMVSPLEEHLKFLDTIAARLKKRRDVPALPARDVANSAGQEFYSKFNDQRVAELLAQHEWVSKERMPI